MKDEDTILKNYIDTCRLEKWFDGALELARTDVEQEMHDKTEGSVKMIEVAAELERIEEQIAADAQEVAEKPATTSRHTPRASVNGMAKSLKSSTSQRELMMI